MSLVKGRDYTQSEAAERLNIHVRTVRRYVTAGILRVRSVKCRTRYVRFEDVEFLARGGNPDDLLMRNAKAG